MATADRVLSILGLFSIKRFRWTAEAAAAELGLSISTTYRYFKSLSKAGLIVPDITGHYVLGPAIIQYDRLTRHFDPLITTARPAMAALVASCRVAGVVLLCRLFRDQVMCVHQEVAGRPDFALRFDRGQPMPAFRGAVSMAIFANLPSRMVRPCYDRHALALKAAGLGDDWPTVRALLRERRGGVCISHGELEAGMLGIAVPILDAGLEVVGSLGLVVAMAQAPDDPGALAAAVAAAGREASASFTRAQARDGVEPVA